MERHKMSDIISGFVDVEQGDRQRAGVRTFWDWECYDPDGNLLWTEQTSNTVQLEGLKKLLNVMFHGETQINPWYCLLFETNTAMTAGTSTYANPVFTECTAYSESVRPAYNEGTASGSNGTAHLDNDADKATFTMTATKYIYGGGLVGGGTSADGKADTSGGGILYCASKFAERRYVGIGYVMKVKITAVAEG